LTESGRLTEVDVDDARRRWRVGDGTFWIDVKESSATELEELLDDLELGGLLKRRLLRVGHGTTIIALREVTFAEWAVFADEACSRRAHVAALCLENLLITLQTEPIEAPTEAQQSLDLSELGPLSTATVLCSLLFAQGARTARAAYALRDRLMQFDQRMDDDPGSVEASELALLKADLFRAEAIIDEQDEAFGLLSEVQTSALDFSQLKGPMGLLTSTANAMRRLDDRLDGRFLDLRRRASEFQQDKLNTRLGFLTVISTIFLPLTLLAGIWGMNFETMPELKHPYGYPLALGLMLLVAGAVAWSLRKRGWFD
jgi:magnesium transporter